MGRQILHVDMDAFFASIEVLDDPRLAGKPVVVGHDGARGVVATASYEARRFGCHSAQPIAAAKRCCPGLVIVPPRGERYREVHERVFSLFASVTPLVEPVSIDEAYLDVTGARVGRGEGGGDGGGDGGVDGGVEVEGADASAVAFARAKAIGAELKVAIREATGLTASVGVAGNKFLAKLASDMEKPDGLTVLAPGVVDEVLWSMRVSRIPGVGPAAGGKLARMGVETIGELRGLSSGRLERVFGRWGLVLYERARGLDDRPVHSDHEARSISQERTFGVDVGDAFAVRDWVLSQAEQVCGRLRRHGRVARTVTVKIRYGDFETITRSTTLGCATDSTREIQQAAAGLFDAWAGRSFAPVRLIGVGVSQLGAPGSQMSLFEDASAVRQKQVDAAVDAITAKFGRGVIGRGAPPRK